MRNLRGNHTAVVKTERINNFVLAATDGDGGAARAAAGAEHRDDVKGDGVAPKKRRKHAASGLSRRWKKKQTKK